MRSFVSLAGINLLFLSIITLAIAAAMDPALFSGFTFPDEGTIQAFKTIFISITLEAFPFILLGVMVSSFMHVFVSEGWIRRFIPRNPILGIGFACLLGILFPVCECGLIPVIRRLIAKGMPLYIGVVFILVGPIVNPIVFAATYTAFRTRPELLYARMGLALLVGFCIGLIVYFGLKKNQLKISSAAIYAEAPEAVHSHHQHRTGSKITTMLEHAGSEFFDMGKYLIFGAIVTAAVQTFISRDSLASVGQGPIGSHLFMMGFAFVLSLCSTSDAFVASSFVGTFSTGSLLTFLVFGPMLDFKSVLMLLSVFKSRFVLLLAGLVIVFVLAGSLVISRFYLTM